MTFTHFHDNLTSDELESITVYRLTIGYKINSKEHGNTHIHYFAAANGALLVVLMTALIIDIFDIERIEITRE
jgi:hypothetical protein